jgi:hypothetical protein
VTASFDKTAKPHDFAVGQRVALHPATDLWMMGARFGEVTAIGRKAVSVRLDATGHVIRAEPALLGHL